MMKTARLFGSGELRIVQEEIPVPNTGETLLRVKTVGICGSDLHWFEHSAIGSDNLQKPLILGHEFSGIRLDTGEMVAVDPAVACGSCLLCQEGHPNLCLNIRFAGHGDQDGALREIIAWPEANLVSVPAHMDPAETALLEPLGVAIHALNLAKLKGGEKIGVIGCGPIGLLVVQAARAYGVKAVISSDRLAHRAEAAMLLGADEAVLAAEDGFTSAAAIGQIGIGLDVVFECAGDNPAVESAVDIVRPGGKVVLVGIPADNRTSFEASNARRKGLTLLLCRRMKHTYPRAIEMVNQGWVQLKPLITDRFSFEEVKQAFNSAQAHQGIKTVVDIS